MKRLLPLLLMAALTCGFTWPFAGKDRCAEATKKIDTVLSAATDVAREKETRQILDLCPGGAADYFLRAVDHQRKKENDEAIRDFQEALKKDDSLAAAHGDLGLLLLGKGLRDDASVELAKGLMGRPDPRYHKAMAEILREEKVYPLALFHYGEAQKKYQNDADIAAGMAECHAQLGHLAEAEKWYRKILSADPRNMRARLGLVAVYRKGNRFDEAVTELRAATGDTPADRNLHRLLGEVLQEKGDREKAKEEFRLAGIDVLIGPDDYVRKGDELFAEKSYERAATAYRAALAANPDLVEITEKLGDAEMAAGRDDAALDAFRKAADRDRANGELHHKIGVLYERKGMLDEAIVEYRKALDYSPGNMAARTRLADIYSARGDFAAAIEQYHAVLKVRSDNSMLHLKLAKALERTRDYKDAVAEYLSAIKLDEDNLEAHRDLASLYGKRGILDGAEAQFKEILRLRKEDADARLALTSLYVKKRRYDDLLALLKEGAEIRPKDANAHYRLGLVYEFKKDTESATGEYKRAVELQPDHAKALNALGRMYLKGGRTEEARQVLEAAKKADPTFAEPGLLLASVKEELTPESATKKVSPHHRVVKKHKSYAGSKKAANKKNGKKAKGKKR